MKASDREARRALMGPWFLRRAQAPWDHGWTYAEISRAVERGHLTSTSIVRGPTTDQFWQIASRVEGIAHLLGRCHACGERVGPSDTSCHACAADFAKWSTASSPEASSGLERDESPDAAAFQDASAGGVDIMAAMERANQWSAHRRKARSRSTTIQLIVAAVIAVAVTAALIQVMLDERADPESPPSIREVEVAAEAGEVIPPPSPAPDPLMPSPQETPPSPGPDSESDQSSHAPADPPAEAPVPPWKDALEKAQDHLDAAGGTGLVSTRLDRAYAASAILETQPDGIPPQQIPAWEAALSRATRQVAVLELLSTGFYE